MGNKILVLMVGLPRSGKTTWAKKEGYPIVNPDSIRYALHGQRFQSLAEPFVWAIALVMVRALFFAGHNKVIVDATHNSKKRRDFWISNDWDIEFHKLNTSRDVCIERAKAINDEEIIPVIERMAEEHEVLTDVELMIAKSVNWVNDGQNMDRR